MLQTDNIMPAGTALLLGLIFAAAAAQVSIPLQDCHPNCNSKSSHITPLLRADGLELDESMTTSAIVVDPVLSSAMPPLHRATPTVALKTSHILDTTFRPRMAGSGDTMDSMEPSDKDLEEQKTLELKRIEEQRQQRQEIAIQKAEQSAKERIAKLREDEARDRAKLSKLSSLKHLIELERKIIKHQEYLRKELTNVRTTDISLKESNDWRKPALKKLLHLETDILKHHNYISRQLERLGSSLQE